MGERAPLKQVLVRRDTGDTDMELDMGLELPNLRREQPEPLLVHSVVQRRRYRFPPAWLCNEQLDKLGRPNATFLHAWAVIFGIFAGLLSVLYLSIQIPLLKGVWRTLPDLVQASANYIPLASSGLAFVTALVLLSCPQCLDIPRWIDLVHNKSTIEVNLSSLFCFTVASLTGCAAGVSVGPQTPMLVLGGFLGKAVGDFMKLSSVSTRVMLLCGSSALLSGFMGIPLVGGLFVLEVSHAYGLEFFEAFSPVIVASIVASFVSRMVFGTMDSGHAIYQDQNHSMYSPSNVAGAVLLGLLGGVTAVVFSCIVRFCTWMADTLRRLVPRADVRCVCFVVTMTLAGAVCGFVGMYYPQTMFWGEEELQSILDGGQQPVGIISVRLLGSSVLHDPIDRCGFVQLFFVKLFCVTVSIAAGFPGGVIFPLYNIAATLGKIIQTIGPDPAFRSLCLMSALEGGSTRTPLAASLFAVLTSYPSSEQSVQMMPAVFPFVLLASYISCAVTSFYPLCPQRQQRQDVYMITKPVVVQSRQSSTDFNTTNWSRGFVNASTTQTPVLGSRSASTASLNSTSGSATHSRSNSNSYFCTYSPQDEFKWDCEV